ncbi:MAG: DEAD/DEAH box helicase [Planctomycetales bacterium]|nr:DEAD/DEAH box helicase [Planctomycetales bacterium]
MKFEDLSVDSTLLSTLDSLGYHTPTAIQIKAIPPVLQGRDIIACAQTGTGKTAAFALPVLQQLMQTSPKPSGAENRRKRSGRRVIRALVLSPTRELASQIGESLAAYGQSTPLKHTVIFGGVRQGSQVNAIQAGVDILVATPGRLLDLIGQKLVDLSQLQILVLDEADHMLDMGFIHDLRKIVRCVPEQRQTLMFSATMPPEIRQLASQWLKRPFQVDVTPVASTPERVAQGVCFLERTEKISALVTYLKSTQRSRTLVFSRTKHGADKIVRCLKRDGILAAAIHGNKSQNQRTAVIRQFNTDRPPVLVATDLAARGLDFADVSHVINFDLPDTPETYVHRIGRTARAGNSGEALSFCTNDDRTNLRSIERLTKQKIQVRTIADSNLPAESSEVANADANQLDADDSNDIASPEKSLSQPAKRRRRRRRRATAQAPTKLSGASSDSMQKPGRRRKRSGANRSKQACASTAR